MAMHGNQLKLVANDGKKRETDVANNSLQVFELAGYFYT